MSMIGYFRRLNPATAQLAMTDAASADHLFTGSGAEGELDVDKAWHAIHFVLNGEPWPGPGLLSQVVFGGEPFGDDLGYGPARHLDPMTVKAIAEELRDIDPDAIVAAVDLSRLDDAEIYSGEWAANGDGSRRYIKDNLRALCTFYATAAARDEAVVAWLG